ncbi:hypothetical protein [Microbacterium sp. NPDC056052]|uniref:hypothetical protein n=1 Tax=Microbacterium sp. NPDC056052 TaxID=3345695 RepID=UPI0035E13C20
MGLFFTRTLIFLASSALGLIVADLLLTGFTIEWSKWWGFVMCVLMLLIKREVREAAALKAAAKKR